MPLSSALALTRTDVLRSMEAFVSENLPSFLKPIEENWQPADLLPDARLDSFFDDVKLLQERARELSYDLLAVLIGDTITEEALPNSEAWFMALKDLPKAAHGGWMRWVRGWTAEENRHGDALNRYLYLTGRVNMRQFEVSTQYLIDSVHQISPYHTDFVNDKQIHRTKCFYFFFTEFPLKRWIPVCPLIRNEWRKRELEK